MLDTTAEYAADFPELPYTHWPTGQTVSKAGFGSYRTISGNEDHRQALIKALTSGINLIDTSANYSIGESERLIGDTLQSLQEYVKRSDIVLVTKIGYLQGSCYEEALQKEQDNAGYQDMVKISEGLWHCIHPDFLRAELKKCLERLQTPFVDALLLHNPEYYFNDPALPKEMPLEEKRNEFYRRIELAFKCMEEFVDQGLIRSYGISSNTFPMATDDLAFCSLDRCLKIAESIKKNHHFFVIQFPFNLVEPEAATELNQEDESLTLIEYAEQHNLVALVNRPLNGLRKGQIIRLSDQGETPMPDTTKLQQQIIDLAAAVDSFSRSVDALKIEDQEVKNILVAYITRVSSLQISWHTFKSFSEWEKYRDELLGKMAMGLTAVNQVGNASITEWTIKVASLLGTVVNSITSYYKTLFDSGYQRNEYIRTVLQRAFPGSFSNIPLSQAAFNAVRTLSGISAVLIGARHVNYVDDVLMALQMEVPEFDRADWMGMKLH